MEKLVHYEPGSKNEIAVVLSCPGQEEEQAVPQGPAKGQTGVNLEDVLDILSKDYNLEGFSRNEITITNSWDQVEYPEKTKRSEATFIEILESKNLDRLSNELANVSKYIFACGQNASVSVMTLNYAGKLSKDVDIIFLEHLSNRALNSSISIDLDGNEIKSYSKASKRPLNETRTLACIRKENRIKRLAVVANEIYKKLKNNS